MKYSKAKIEECANWVRIHGLMEYGGATLKSFCKAMDIDDDSYYLWMNTKPEFSEAIQKAKADFKATQEERLVESLMQSAVGYEATESRVEYAAGPNGEKKIKKQTVMKKQIQPNTGAAIFLLTNIAPEKWKNKLNTEHSGEINQGLNIIVQNEEDKELINRAVNEL